MRALVILLLAAIAIFVVWQASQGSDVPNAPGVNDLPIPDNPGQAADGLWNKIDAAPQWVWTQVAPILAVMGLLMYISRKYPRLMGAIVGAAVISFIIVMVKNH